MPTRWGALPNSGIDKNPTPVDRIIRDPKIVAAVALVMLVLPPIGLTAAWLAFGQPLLDLMKATDPAILQFVFSLIMMGLVLFIVIHLCAALILAERKISAFIQDRQGPNRVGFFGLLQPIADGIKFMLKEDVTPARVDKPIFILAPCIAFVVAMISFPVIPWAGTVELPWGGTLTTQVASLDIGVLYILAINGLGVYGVVLAGWASNNKYAHYGGMRAAAQMLSYEIPIGLGVLVLLLVSSGTLRLEVIQDQQTATGLWNVFLHPIMFLLVLTANYAETNRAPFDLAECEQELIAGFHTEYSSMKFALFFLAEYAHMIIGSAVLVTLFLGGWEPLPGVSLLHGNNTWWAALIKFHIFWGKIIGLIGLYMLVRWTVPRFRFDQLMKLAWKGMIPIAMALVVIEGVLVAVGIKVDPTAGFVGNFGVLAVHLLVNAVLLGFILWQLSRTKAPVTGRQDNLPEIEVVPSRPAGQGGVSHA